MDAENVLLLTYMSIGAVVGIAYSVYNYITKVDPQQFELKRFVASIIFGIVIGMIGGYGAVATGTNPGDVEWWTLMGTLFLTYSGAQLYLNRIVDWLWAYFTGTKLGQGSKATWIKKNTFATAMGIRKMSMDGREWLTFDLPQWAQMPTLACVDDAESRTPMPFQYAIQTPGWIFLIENGVITGGKHYFFSWNTQISWKPISGATLAQIRETGKFPEYSQLT